MGQAADTHPALASAQDEQGVAFAASGPVASGAKQAQEILVASLQSAFGI